MAFIIAEIGVNHAGRLDYALKLIAAAAEAGVDAVKFQAFTPHVLTPLDWGKRAMLKGLALTREELIMCAAEARYKQVEFMCTPMDEEWLAFCVDTLRVKRVKIGSGQNRDEVFVRAVAATGLPVIISNGIADNAEFCRAVAWLLGSGASDITLLSCVSKYPAPENEILLWEIERLRDLWPQQKIGFSCHARSMWPSIAAVYAGAVCVEKHICLPGTSGPDISSSLPVDELSAWVREIRAGEKARV